MKVETVSKGELQVLGSASLLSILLPRVECHLHDLVLNWFPITFFGHCFRFDWSQYPLLFVLPAGVPKDVDLILSLNWQTSGRCQLDIGKSPDQQELSSRRDYPVTSLWSGPSRLTEVLCCGISEELWALFSKWWSYLSQRGALISPDISDSLYCLPS